MKCLTQIIRNSAKFYYQSKAVEEINNIWIYTANIWSIEQANHYYNLIFDEVEFTVKNFELTKDFKLKRGYKFSKMKSHLIFFKKNKSMQIEIIRVLHERMDIKNRLKINQCKLK